MLRFTYRSTIRRATIGQVMVQGAQRRRVRVLRLPGRSQLSGSAFLMPDCGHSFGCFARIRHPMAGGGDQSEHGSRARDLLP